MNSFKSVNDLRVLLSAGIMRFSYDDSHTAEESYSYGATLKGLNDSETWNPEKRINNPNGKIKHYFGDDQTLIIKTALLGTEAKPGELNVLEVETMGLEGPIKIPIALLDTEKTSHINLNLSFPDPPVTFTLIRGSGPVYIFGQHRLRVTLGEVEDIEDEWEKGPRVRNVED